MKKIEQVRGLTVELKLLITEDDLNKIKKLKNPNKSKVYKIYNDMLFNCLKSLEIPKQKNDKFNSVEELERFNKNN
ncbi:MAG: hypothetical protein J6Y02_19530 [Pseudobutyrivibrio sp.]|nr:hypothetical protein [Pseudobutyrivibrio sp.]